MENARGDKRAREGDFRKFVILQHVMSHPGGVSRKDIISHVQEVLEDESPVSERTIARDLDALVEEGMLSNRRSGYTIGDQCIRPISLSSSEVFELLTALDRYQGVCSRPDQLALAKEKLLACVLGQRVVAEVSRAKRLASVRIVKGRPSVPDADTADKVDRLEAAAWDCRVVRFRYLSKSAGTRGRAFKQARGAGSLDAILEEASAADFLDVIPKQSREVNPLGVVYYWVHDAWYLAAQAGPEKEIKHFRVDRMEDLEVLDATFQYPEDFSLAEHLAPCWGVLKGPLTRVKIRFYDDFNVISRVMRETAHRRKRSITWEKDGSIIYEDEVAGIHEIRTWVRGFGSSAEVLEPAELRESLIKVCFLTLQRYGISTPKMASAKVPVVQGWEDVNRMGRPEEAAPASEEV